MIARSGDVIETASRRGSEPNFPVHRGAYHIIRYFYKHDLKDQAFQDFILADVEILQQAHRLF